MRTNLKKEGISEPTYIIFRIPILIFLSNLVFTSKIEIQPIVYYNTIHFIYVLISISYAGIKEVNEKYLENKF